MTRPDRVRRARLSAQLLAGRPARSAEGVAAQLLAVQAQNLRAGRLAVRARTAGLTAASVNAELESGAVLITWIQRGTLHLIRPEDYPWLLGLAAPTLRVANVRRLHQCGFTPDRAAKAVELIVRWLGDDGPLKRSAIGERLEAAGYALEPQALVHLLFV
ncbi:MAG TPA: crosslink repair DNA glycosylase YcaQ family protein, partial [Gaiellales bacterium]